MPGRTRYVRPMQQDEREGEHRRRDRADRRHDDRHLGGPERLRLDPVLAGPVAHAADADDERAGEDRRDGQDLDEPPVGESTPRNWAAAIPSAMTASPVRNQARNVRSFAMWVRARVSGSTAIGRSLAPRPRP